LITTSGTGGSIEGGSNEIASAVSSGWTVDVGASIEDSTRPTGRRDLPTNCVPNDQGLGEDVKTGRACRKALRSIRPVSSAGNQNSNVASKILKRKAPARGPSQDLQDCDL
jgi:hypothetical protein